MIPQNQPGPLRISIDPDLRDLIPGFLQNRRLDIQALQEAVVVGNFDTIRTVGHRMRGDGGGYGFHMISEIGHALETAALQKNSQEITVRVQELTTYLGRIEVVYE
ncbi:MAG: Hpt domain-containing protein [Nitrospirales bacterium]|nr:Hpt domain-containing protein [Nitrospirales bacterium]